MGATEILVTGGVAAVLAAAVGGGSKAFGIEAPLLTSTKRQIIVLVSGLGLIAAGLINGGALDRSSPPPAANSAEAAEPAGETESAARNAVAPPNDEPLPVKTAEVGPVTPPRPRNPCSAPGNAIAYQQTQFNLEGFSRAVLANPRLLVKLREEPSPAAAVVCDLEPGMTFEVSEARDGWRYARIPDGRLGYVRAELVTIVPGSW